MHPTISAHAALIAQSFDSLPPLVEPDRDAMFPYRLRPQRTFIVTHGRSGSSLLSAILDRSGASFGPASDPGSDTFNQHWESRRIERAIRCALVANRHFQPGMSGLQRAAYRFWRSRAKRLLRSGLAEAPYSKNRWNTLILPLAEKLGYRPVVVVSHRRPSEVALSDMPQLKNAPSVYLPAMARTYADCLYSVVRYGGVVIDHEDLVDPANEDWAQPLADVTGLDAAALLAARRSLLRPRRSEPAPELWAPAEIERVARSLHAMRSQAIPATVK